MGGWGGVGWGDGMKAYDVPSVSMHEEDLYITNERGGSKDPKKKARNARHTYSRTRLGPSRGPQQIATQRLAVWRLQNDSLPVIDAELVRRRHGGSCAGGQ